MKLKSKIIWIASACLAVFVIAAVGFFYFRPQAGSPNQPAQTTPDTFVSDPSGPVSLDNLEVFASGLRSPRDLIFDSRGQLLVSTPPTGEVVLLPSKQVLVSGLNRPHGLAISGSTLYIAETDQVTAYDYNPDTRTVTNRRKLIDLPSGGSHWTRSLLVHQNRLYISIGSTCNVCVESDYRRSAVFVSDLNGGNFRPFATGLRNAVFLTSRNDQIWVTEMGRDHLGDDLPSDEINILSEAKDYGWPYCYGQNIHDTQFDTNKYIRDPCQDKQASFIDLPAHSAPLGLVFTPQGQLLVSLHGSWNRSTPSGYKVIRIDPQTKTQSDFITGFLDPRGKKLGRPVDLEFDTSGNLYISDDLSGKIYRMKPDSASQSIDKLIIEDLKVGTGPAVKSGDTVTMHYTGTLSDGRKFDSSYDRGQPFTTLIGAGQVIAGWDQGVPGMQVGGRRKLTIPASLGYGDRGVPGVIPPQSTLIFEVELIGIR